jgi:signal transduction histidine kinase
MDITTIQQENKQLHERIALLEKKLQDEKHANMVQTNRLKDEFIANVSHELRTPLNGILGLTEALQEEVYGPLTERQHTALHRIEKGGRELLATVNDILDLAKMAAGKEELSITAMPIADVCHYVVQKNTPTGTTKIAQPQPQC